MRDLAGGSAYRQGVDEHFCRTCGHVFGSDESSWVVRVREAVNVVALDLFELECGACYGS